MGWLSRVGPTARCGLARPRGADCSLWAGSAVWGLLLAVRLLSRVGLAARCGLAQPCWADCSLWAGLSSTARYGLAQPCRYSHRASRGRLAMCSPALGLLLERGELWQRSPLSRSTRGCLAQQQPRCFVGREAPSFSPHPCLHLPLPAPFLWPRGGGSACSPPTFGQLWAPHPGPAPWPCTNCATPKKRFTSHSQPLSSSLQVFCIHNSAPCCTSSFSCFFIFLQAAANLTAVRLSIQICHAGSCEQATLC